MPDKNTLIAVLGLVVAWTLFPGAGSAAVQAPQNAVTQALQGRGTPAIPRLQGTIKDPSGGVMPGVDVSVMQGPTIVKATKTNAAGEFVFDLPAGAYELAVIAPDFKIHTQAMRVGLNMPPLEIKLSVEGITSVVEVVDKVNVPTVDASVSLDATVLTDDQITDLPDDEESLLAYLQSLAGGEGNAQLIIDGFEGGRLPTRDQIAQIIIEPNSFNANGTGPRITIVSKQPGPTRWAGNVNYRYQDSALNARTPGTTNKPASHRSQIDFSTNGPVIKGKLGMTVNLSKSQSDSGDNFIKATTPSGPISKAYTSPSTSDSVGFSQNFYLSKNHTFGDNFSYNQSRNANIGIGQFTLEERAADSRNHSWNFQVSDNLTITSKMTNTFQFRISRSGSRTIPRTGGVAINVLDAFNGGGSPNQSESRSGNFNVSESLRWTPTTKWNLQFAINANHQSSYNNARNNYLGTFVFASLEDYLAGTPQTFTQTFGNPVADTKQTDANTSFQATYRLKPNMSFSMGAQYTVQSHLRDYNNIGPTMQYQVQVKKRTIISLGARLSYPNNGFSMGSFEQLLRGNGTTNQFTTSISNPTYPDAFASGMSGTINGLTNAQQKRSEGFVSPYAINSQLSLTESLPKNWRVNTSFNVTRQVHQMRNRNINAPYPGIPLDPFLTPDQVDLLRPFFPIVGRINQFESVGNSLQKNLNFQVQIPPTKKFYKIVIQGAVQYGLSWAADDNQAQNPYDMHADWARNDQRQRMQGTLNIRPPHYGTYNLQFSANSGRTYNVTTGRDENLDQAFNDRPLGVKRNSMIGPGSYNINLNYTSPVLSFRRPKAPPKAIAAGPAGNAASSQAALIEQLTQTAQSAGLPAAAIQQLISQIASQPGLLNLINLGDLNSSANSKQPSLLHPQSTLSVRVSNLLNNAQSYGYSGVITSPLFGKSTGFNPGRSIALTLTSRF